MLYGLKTPLLETRDQTGFDFSYKLLGMWYGLVLPHITKFLYKFGVDAVNYVHNTRKQKFAECVDGGGGQLHHPRPTNMTNASLP